MGASSSFDQVGTGGQWDTGATEGSRGPTPQAWWGTTWYMDGSDPRLEHGVCRAGQEQSSGPAPKTTGRHRDPHWEQSSVVCIVGGDGCSRRATAEHLPCGQVVRVCQWHVGSQTMEGSQECPLCGTCQKQAVWMIVCHGSCWSGETGGGGQALGPVRLGGSQWCVSVWGTVSCLSSVSVYARLPEWLTLPPSCDQSAVLGSLPHVSHWLRCPLCPLYLLVSPATGSCVPCVPCLLVSLAPHADLVTLSLSPPRKVAPVSGRPLCPPPQCPRDGCPLAATVICSHTGGALAL